PTGIHQLPVADNTSTGQATLFQGIIRSLLFCTPRHPHRVVMSGKAQQQSRLKELIARGREQGYLTYAEVNDHLPEDISDPEQVEDIIRMINDMGITVFETAP